jgi:hypothetical protein
MIMAKGMNVKCSRCLTAYNIYDDIQVKAVGICPICNNVEGFRFEHPFTFDYNAGNVDPHLGGEENYDWDWLESEKGKGTQLSLVEAGLEDEPSGAFDQDDDLINANLGWN